MGRIMDNQIETDKKMCERFLTLPEIGMVSPEFRPEFRISICLAGLLVTSYPFVPIELNRELLNEGPKNMPC